MRFDYDQPLIEEMLRDTRAVVRRLAAGSILLVTVDAEPRIPDGPDYEPMTCTERRELAPERLQQALRRYRVGPIDRSCIDKGTLPGVFAEVLNNVVCDATIRRRALSVQQLLNFKYADGAQMLTVGWLLDEEPSIQRPAGTGFLARPFVNDTTTPLRIDVPPMPIREELLLDQYETGELPVEVGDDVVEAFRDYRRHYPIYFETIT